FCDTEPTRIIAEHKLGYAIRDGFPVTKHHTLLIPKRHVSDYFDLYQPEINALNALSREVKAQIVAADSSVAAFHIGINVGIDAGQTISHCHVHLIPRRSGDVPDPRGGVRGVIPGKQGY